MARPKSEDKRNAILAAAAQVIAEQGLGAPTARIAKAAGVAEGTLFTYFASKDELLNQLYLELKSALYLAIGARSARSDSLRDRTRQIWEAYVGWGIAHPAKRKAMQLLSVSDKIGADTRAATEQAFAGMQALMQEVVRGGAGERVPVEFVGALVGALAETTMEFAARQPAEAALYVEVGFEMFWNAVAGR